MEVIILQGPSGSGKTTYAKRLQESLVARGKSVRIVSIDDYFMDEGGEYRFDSKRYNAAHNECFASFMEAILEDIGTIIVDNTNTTDREISPYTRAAGAYGYRFRIVRMLCDVDKAIERAVHGVPELTIRNQFSRLERLKWPFETVDTNKPLSRGTRRA